MGKKVVEPGCVFVLSAPSGTGKTTLVRMLVQDNPRVVESISATTRPPRHGEVEGRDYFFLTEPDFKKRLAAGEFLEHAQVFGYDYGTLRSYVEKKVAEGKHVFLVIDTQGVMHLRDCKFSAVYIFLSPPSTAALETRLHGRKTESAEVIAKRLACAKEEMQRIHYYDYHIINDDLCQAYEQLKKIVAIEENKTKG